MVSDGLPWNLQSFEEYSPEKSVMVPRGYIGIVQAKDFRPILLSSPIVVGAGMIGYDSKGIGFLAHFNLNSNPEAGIDALAERLSDGKFGFGNKLFEVALVLSEDSDLDLLARMRSSVEKFKDDALAFIGAAPIELSASYPGVGIDVSKGEVFVHTFSPGSRYETYLSRIPTQNY